MEKRELDTIVAAVLAGGLIKLGDVSDNDIRTAVELYRDVLDEVKAPRAKVDEETKAPRPQPQGGSKFSFGPSRELGID